MDQRLRYKGYPVRVSDKIPDTRKAWCAYQERRILEDTLKTRSELCPKLCFG